jgi:predicted AAA+ superfamily ATPase
VIKRTIENDSTLDASGHHLDRNILSPIFKLVCRYTGQQIKVKTFQEEMHKLYNINVSSKDVLESLHFLSDSMLMCQIPPLEIAKKTQSQGNKLCLCDHFLRQAWLQEVVPISPRSLVDAHETVLTLTGHLVEGIIGYYLNAISGLDMAWFPARQNEPEIDFVVTMGLKRLPIEIKYRRGKPKNGDLMGIKSFCKQKKYNAEFGLVITQEYAGPIGDNVIAIPASTFLSVL